jgi:hypothetical protein
MRWYYLSHFTRYLQALEKIKVYPSDRNDILGGDPSAPKTGSFMFVQLLFSAVNTYIP